MVLNPYGAIVEKCWFDLPNHYRNLKLDVFCVMPNHIHSIVVIDNVGGGYGTIDGNIDGTIVETGLKPVSTMTVPSSPSLQSSSSPHTPITPIRHGLFESIYVLKIFSARRINGLGILLAKTFGNHDFMTMYASLECIRDYNK
jgi:hypothetical protein